MTSHLHRKPGLLAAIAIGCAAVLLAAGGGPDRVRGAEAGAADSPFGLTRVWDMHLAFEGSRWAALMPEERPRPGGGPGGPGGMDTEYPWSVATFSANGGTLTNLAVRYKGNSSFNMSRGGWKRPFRLDFNRGAKGRSWHGAGALSLNNNINDATQFREVLAYEVYRRAGLPAPRTAFARLRLTVGGQRTNVAVGLYTAVEIVDGDFLDAHFKDSRGLLLKPERLQGLEYLGPEWPAYVSRYEPKTDVRPADAARFIAWTRLIARAEDAVFERELPGYLDLEGFLRFVAVTAWLGNYDSFVGNGHNYYLFLPADARPATFVPWDLNEAFGGHPGAGPRRQQAGFSILRPQGSANRLVERVLANPAWAARYRREVEALQAGACESGRLRDLAAQLAGVLREFAGEESPAARAAFRRVALGESVAEVGPEPPGGRAFPWPGAGEEGTLADWIELRAGNVAGELAGTRTATTPRMGRGPGGPGGPRRPGGPQLGGPGGLVPPPGR